ncbi:ACP S-malonyltransferase [Halocatena halophila]|uniref:ACP S-malonyltransferase n=1 Tax=Halocatena halophila TaxID=2814576 RepID=UPI002ED225D1
MIWSIRRYITITEKYMSRDNFSTKTAFVFPGQGSQKTGMARSFYEQDSHARAVFKEMDAAVDFELLDLCFEGDSEELRPTRNTQPTVLAAGIAAYMAVHNQVGRFPHYMSGHSLGQYTAVTAAGGLDPTTSVQVVRKRGEVMEAVCEDIDGRMVAVLLVSPNIVASICEEFTEVSVAGFNGPKQTVISGTATAVDGVIETLKKSEDNPIRFIDLDISEPFHSPIMKPAEQKLAPVLQRYQPDTVLHTPVVSSTTKEMIKNPNEVLASLKTQITNPVDWTGVVDRLKAEGVQQYVEFPPSGTLASFITTIHPDAEVVAIDSIEDIDKLKI